MRFRRFLAQEQVVVPTNRSDISNNLYEGQRIMAMCPPQPTGEPCVSFETVLHRSAK